MNKRNLRDTSFLIPVRIDSDDRLKNIGIVIRYILDYFDTNIILLESDTRPLLPDNLKKNIEYIFIQNEKLIFKKTEINNILIQNCKTAIAIIYDSDVIVPPQQLLSAVDRIRQNKALVSLPYDGQFLEVDRYNKSLFESNPVIEFLLNGDPIFRTNTFNSVGGCFVFDVITYKKCGMDNENIEGWGHEDAERIKRLKKLGYSIFRPQGPLYHLYHIRKRNSYFFDDGTASRSFDIYFKICSLNKEDLQNEIESWNWKE